MATFTGGEFVYLLISKSWQKVDIWHNVYEINWDFWSLKVFCVLCSPYKSPFYFDDFFLTLSKWKYFARFERNFDQNWIYNSFEIKVVNSQIVQNYFLQKLNFPREIKVVNSQKVHNCCILTNFSSKRSKHWNLYALKNCRILNIISRLFSANTLS